MAGFFDDIGAIDPNDNYADDSSGYLDDPAVEPDINIFPTVSDTPQSGASGNPQTAGTIQNLLGSVGSLIQNAPKIGTSLGTAVGNAEHQLNTGVSNYNSAQHAAVSGNNLSTWFKYASTTDKLMIGLAIVGIVIALKE